MAARVGKSVFICQNCGYQAGKWLGRCPECGCVPFAVYRLIVGTLVLVFAARLAG